MRSVAETASRSEACSGIVEIRNDVDLAFAATDRVGAKPFGAGERDQPRGRLKESS